MTHNSKLNEVNRIGLKVNGIWCVLPQDVSISIEEQNPLFSDSGSFSYPIELSISQNRELFKSIDSPQGRIRPQDLDGLPFELWFDGVMLLYGSTETDEDLDIDEDKCSINLVSGNGDFQSKIEGMQCTDVPLMDELYLGDYYPGFTGTAQDKDDVFSPFVKFEYALDPSNNMDYKNYNVSDPYPIKPYCNIRVCVKQNGKDSYWDSPYKVLDADRPWSGVCFYVAYFFKCLFQHLGYVVREEDNHMLDVEDMKRLAFVTTKCEHRLGEKESLGKVSSLKVGKYIEAELLFDDVTKELNPTYKHKVYASEKNFPEIDVSTLIESMLNAFGLKIVADEKENRVSVYFMRDILRDNEVVDVPMRVIGEIQVAYSKVKGVRLTYGVDDDTAFSYNEYSGDIKVVPSYSEIVRTYLSAYDKKLYVVSNTGDKYRVKIDEYAENEGDVKNLNPALFGVAQFNDFVLGEDSEDAEELKLSFTPLIENDARSRYLRMSETDQTLALYVDGAEIKDPAKITTNNGVGKHGNTGHTWYVDLRQNRFINFVDDSDKNPITEHDCGFMLGVMRGPGSKSGYTISVTNYDGNGNDAWVTVEDEYAFTSDSIDAYGNHYDYNGEIDGGVVNLETSISLKTHIQTAQELGLKNPDGTDADWGINSQAAKRGLADRFMSEYMNFLLNRKTVNMEVDTTLSQLTSLSWFKQLRISDVVGRLKSRSYTLTNSGVSDMSIELYTIN